MSNLEKWNMYTVRRLRQKCKTKLPVRLVYRKFGPSTLRDYLAMTCYFPTYYEIHMNRDFSYRENFQYLLHEWAHAMTGPGHNHDIVWAKNFAKVYKVVYSCE